MPKFPEASYSIDDKFINIVSTKDTLGGAPRLDGHRIAVYHILSFYRNGYSISDIASKDVYSHLSEAQVRAALHYAVDYPEAVERSSKPRETPLMLTVSYNSKKGGPTLSVFEIGNEKPGALAEETISIDDLPAGYKERDLHAAWCWLHEQSDQ